MTSIFDIERELAPAAIFQPLIEKYQLEHLITGQDLVNCDMAAFDAGIDADGLKNTFPLIDFPNDIDDLEAFCVDINTASFNWHANWLKEKGIIPDYPQGACLEEGYILGYDHDGCYHIKPYNTPMDGAFIIDAQKARLKSLSEIVELTNEDKDYLADVDLLT